jgi:hypothetical protein
VDITIAIPLVAALIGAISGILGGFLAGRRQLKLEHEKWLLSREDDLAKETRIAVAELTYKLASATHSIVWLGWKANFFPKQLTQDDILKYEEETHGVIPDIVGSLTIISALNSEIYSNLLPLVYSYYNLEGEMGEAAAAFKYYKDSRQNTTDKMAEIFPRARDINRELEEIIENVFREKTKLGNK